MALLLMVMTKRKRERRLRESASATERSPVSRPASAPVRAPAALHASEGGDITLPNLLCAAVTHPSTILLCNGRIHEGGTRALNNLIREAAGHANTEIFNNGGICGYAASPFICNHMKPPFVTSFRGLVINFSSCPADNRAAALNNFNNEAAAQANTKVLSNSRICDQTASPLTSNHMKLQFADPFRGVARAFSSGSSDKKAIRRVFEAEQEAQMTALNAKLEAEKATLDAHRTALKAQNGVSNSSYNRYMATILFFGGVALWSCIL